MKINIECNDQYIINKEELIVNLIKLMISDEPINITLNGEGPCAASLGLYSLLDNLKEQFNYTKKIQIETANLVEKHETYQIIKTPALTYLNSAKRITTPCDKKKSLKHFGIFIGHSNKHRLKLSSYIHAKHNKKSIQSYHTNVKDPYHRRFIGFEDLLFNNDSNEDIKNAFSLIQKSPITLDSINQYPILQPTTYNLTKIYPKFFVEIVALSFNSGQAFHLDEKIWRPIIMKTPFIVQGPIGYLDNLKKLGFKTFSNWWPEGYSSDHAEAQAESIKFVINDLSKMSVQDLHLIYKDMLPILDHNYNHLMNLDYQKIMKVFL